MRAAVFVKVVETEGCQACRLTKQALDRQGTPYEALDGSDPQVRALVATLGYRQAPVVLVGVETEQGASLVDDWSGLRPDKLRALAEWGGLESEAAIDATRDLARGHLELPCASEPAAASIA